MITIQNKTARAIVLILNHPAFWKKRWGYTVKPMWAMTYKNGTPQRHLVKRSIMGSLTLPPLTTIDNLPDEIVGCLQIKNLEKTGRIAIEKHSVTINIPTNRQPRTRKMRRMQTEEIPVNDAAPADGGNEE
jgi:hypothetical protein